MTHHHPDNAPEITHSLQRRSQIVVLRRVAQLFLPLGLIAMGCGVFAYLKMTTPQPVVMAPQIQSLNVQTIPVHFQRYQPTLTLYGTTVAGRQVALRALVAGPVKSTHPQLSNGGVTNAGTTLLQVDPFEYENELQEVRAQLKEARAKLAEISASMKVEQGNLASAQQQLRLAKTDLSRAETLSKRGSLAQSVVDTRRLTTLQRAQSVEQSRNTLDVWQARHDQQLAFIERLQTNLARAAQKLRDTTLKSPFDAYVTDVNAQAGRMLSVSDPVATLIDRDRIEVLFAFTHAQFARLATSQSGLIGRSVEVVWDVGRRTVHYAATIRRIDASAEPDSGSIQVFARIETPSKPLAIRAGLFVEIRMPDVTVHRAFKVPADVIYNGDAVYVVRERRLSKRAVEILGTTGDSFLITGDLIDGEEVLVTRLTRPDSKMDIHVLPRKDA